MLSGNVFFATGNSDSSGTTYDGIANISESVVKVSADLTQMLSIFTPAGSQFGVATLDRSDDDFGSGGVLLLPDQPGVHPHLVVAAGKVGQMYLLDRDNLGGLTLSSLGAFSIGACWCGPAFYTGADGVGRVVASGGSQISTWKVATGTATTLISEASSAQLTTGQDGGFFTSISSNGTTAGSQVIWAVSRPVDTSPAQISLYAFNAVPSGGILSQLFAGVAGTWPTADGNSNIVPVVANGYVYVASFKELAIFGMSGSGTLSSTAALHEQQPVAMTYACLALDGLDRPKAATEEAAPADANRWPANSDALTGAQELARRVPLYGSQYALNDVQSVDSIAQQVGDTQNKWGHSNPLVATNEIPPSAPTPAPAASPMIDGISRLYGIVVSIEGDIVTLQLRNGKTLPVDLTEALYNSESVVPVVGKAVVVTGKFAASGVLHAHAMLRAKRASKLWKPDSGPQ